MSAWIVTRSHIDLLVNAAKAWDQWGLLGDPVEMGQTLWTENGRSVSYRYPDHPAPVLCYGLLPRVVHVPDPIVVLKSIGCLEYQSCERPDYYESRAYKLLRTLQSIVIVELPGYDAAPWGIDDPPSPVRVVQARAEGR